MAFSQAYIRRDGFPSFSQGRRRRMSTNHPAPAPTPTPASNVVAQRLTHYPRPPPTSSPLLRPTARSAPPPSPCRRRRRPTAAPGSPFYSLQSLSPSQPLPSPLPINSPPPSSSYDLPTTSAAYTPPPALPSLSSWGSVASLSHSVLRRKLSDPCHVSSTVQSILSSLESLILLVDQIPPLPQPGRYGNPAFRSWHEKLESRAESIMLEFLPEDLRVSKIELVPYFLDSFGNATRIDYGTGHETNFAAWLYCLARLGVIKEEDYPAVVTRVFAKYLELMRKLQFVYSLEPAGSHGVWGLDDYHFLPFIFGAAQLIEHKYMRPKSIHNEDILQNFSNEYMYLSCIQVIRKVKKGPFSEHSPLLDDISGVPGWTKVNNGLLKMYKAEVLEKVPIMQHFLFGWLIPWE